MKKYLAVTFLTLASLSLGAKKIHIKGSLVLAPSSQIDITPQFSLIYNGMQATSDADGFFSIPVENYQGTPPALLITKPEYITYSFEKKNTPHRQTFELGKPHLYLVPNKSESGLYSWKQTTLASAIVPENCIVLLMDPKFVSHISAWKQAVQDWFILLPRIHIKEGADISLIRQASVKSQLTAALDHRFSQPIRMVRNETPKTQALCKVCLPH